MSYEFSSSSDFHKIFWGKINFLEKLLLEIATDESSIPQDQYIKELSLFKELLRENLPNYVRIEESVWPVLAETNKSLFLSISKLTDDHNLILRKFDTFYRIREYDKSISVFKELLTMLQKHIVEEEELMQKINPTKNQMRQMSLLIDSTTSQEKS